MRHSGIVVQPDPSIDNFEVQHVIGTPGIGLTFQAVKNWENPRYQTASLLAMDFVAWIPRNRVRDLEYMFRQVPIQVSWSWNCQNWVQGGLQKMVEAGILTHREMESAIEKQQRAVSLPYTGNTPNSQALD
jgi:hypothetical protein